MGCIKVKMIKFFTIGAVSICCLTACGAAVDDGSGLPKSSAENTAVKDSEGEQDNTESGQETASEKPQIKAGNMDKTNSVMDSGVPVYGAEEKESIREYLKNLPDQYLSFQEAKKLGIIREGHVNKGLKQKEKEYFGEQWMSFYTNARESKDILEGERNKDIGTVYEGAVVIVCYTIEGDPIYKYISYSCRDGKFFLYEDSSRDEYACRSSRDAGYQAVYGDIKWRLDRGDGGEEIEFYLVKNSEISSKKIEQMLNAEDGYDNKKLYPIFSMEYIPAAIDGMVSCQ